MAQNRSFDPPISRPPDVPPRTVLQVNVDTQYSEWGAIPACVPRLEGGVPLQRMIVGKSDGPIR